MKIIVSEFSSGFADSSYLLCNYLSRYNSKNNVIYLSDTENFYFNQVDNRVKTKKLYKTFISGTRYKKGSFKWLIDRLTTSVCNAIRRNKYVKQKEPDVVLVMATLSIIDQFFLKAIKKNTIVIMTVHDVIVPQKSLSWRNNSLKRTYEIADGLIVHTEKNKQQLIEKFGINRNKIHVIHHGIEIIYKKLGKEYCINQLNISNKLPILLFYGGIRESKGLDVLLNALINVECQLIIAGNMLYNESFEKYDKLIKKNNIRCLKYIEFTSDEFRDVLFQASDFVILPYKEFYSQSGVFMQAIHYRKPVIVTDVSSFRDFVEKYNMGYVCKANSIKELHQVIIQAISDFKNGKWNDCTSIESAVIENSWQESARKYTEYFNNFNRRLL